ncbi:MAG: hypothetical protein ACRYFS_20905 [Janthinobacterium lividum]
MTVTSKSRSKLETETIRPTAMADPTIQERIDAMIAEAVKNAPPALSLEEQRKKNQAAIEVLRQWREEDKTDDPRVIAQRKAELDEFMAAMNESHTSNRVIYP